MKQRKAFLKRKTKETNIAIKLNLDGSGKTDIKTPIPFFSHLLENLGRHGAFDLNVRVTGDIEVDQHHTVEDTGIVLGEVFEKALGNKKGINRAGYFVFPMDEALSLVALDISGRAYLKYEVRFAKDKVGDLDTDLIKHFFESFCRALKITAHIRLVHKGNGHHQAESMFKAFGKAMKMACSKDERLLKEVPSTKGKI